MKLSLFIFIQATWMLLFVYFISPLYMTPYIVIQVPMYGLIMLLPTIIVSLYLDIKELR